MESITVQDDSGEACRVFIDGYIGYSDDTSQALEEFVEEGAYISAVGFVSHDAEGNRLRVRDRSEILPAEEGQEPVPVIYVVNVSIQNGSFEGAKTAVEGQAYTGKIVAAEGYKLPAEITVKVSGEELSAGGFLRSADYTYDAKTGEITINADAVTGAIEISAVCEADQARAVLEVRAVRVEVRPAETISRMVIKEAETAAVVQMNRPKPAMILQLCHGSRSWQRQFWQQARQALS